MTPAVPSSSTSPLEARLERLERALVTISAEVAAIRAELGAAAPGQTGAQPASPAAAGAKSSGFEERPAPPGPTSHRGARTSRAAETIGSIDFERLMGRYGMLAIAVFAAVAAVGTFLSWAIGHGYLRLDPPVRVIVGLAAAAGLGVWGLRLRRRERSFGSSILGLALVIVEVCAYAAGPEFHLVPSWLAFGGAAFVSWALALFAHAENDEPLWCVGFGGAALAPFATSDGSGNVYALLVYGLLILLPACFAISHRVWPVAWRVFYAVAAVFSLLGAELAHRTSTTAMLGALAFPFVIAAAGIVPFAPDERKRAALRWLGCLGALASFWTPSLFTPMAQVVAAWLLGIVVLWLFLVDRLALVPQSSLLAGTRDNPGLLDWIDAGVIPLILVYEAGNAVRTASNPLAVYGVGTILLGAFAWRRVVGAMRDAAALATVAVACGVVAGLRLEEPLGELTAFVVLGLGSLAAHRARPSLSWLGAGLFLLVASAAASIGFMIDRHAYAYTPFVTEASATALVVLLGFVCTTRFWWWLRVATRAAMGARPEYTYASNSQLLLRSVALAPWVWAFLWGMTELSMAYSPSTSTLLLVTYFAATAVGCVGAGRVRHSARLRQTGLCLALVAAATAFYGATSYFDFGARIVAYLVTSAFLLGIAYWYRQPGGMDAAATA